MTRSRRCIVLRGEPAWTEAAATEVVSRLEAVCWVGAGRKPALGTAWDAVVLDLHGGLDADRLGQVHGLVRGGGALVLRVPLEAPPQPGLSVLPFAEDQVTTRFWRRFLRIVEPAADPVEVLAPPPRPSGGTAEQAAVVEVLRKVFAGSPALVVLTADRGRGKSSALGLALHGWADAVVTSGLEASAAEVRRFAPEVPWVPPRELLHGALRPSVIAVDEAAQLPLPLLQQIVLRHPEARIAFATTTRGYEGTGRGFVLRFRRWLADQARPVHALTLHTPIRWDPDDPLEALVFRLLALDAEPAPLPAARGDLVSSREDREALAEDEVDLRSLFGLLIGAHYRTTPSDLHRLLDAPNLEVFTLQDRGAVVAASLVAREGGLPAELCAQMASGRVRVRGHALADTLVSHLGCTAAGSLSMARSVRIVTHPDRRREGLASRLVQDIEAAVDVDLFGTVFGATPGLLRFRRGLGYRLVRVGGSRGSRTGEPAAVMVHPRTQAAVTLVDALQGALARDLPVQLALLEADGGGRIPDALREALLADLPAPLPLTDEARQAMVAGYLAGARHYEAAATGLEASVRASDRGSLSGPGRILVEGRVLERRGWPEVAAAAGFDTVPAAMRALRRTLGGLLDQSGF